MGRVADDAHGNSASDGCINDADDAVVNDDPESMGDGVMGDGRWVMGGVKVRVRVVSVSRCFKNVIPNTVYYIYALYPLYFRW